MDALQAAQSVYDSTIRNLANKELVVDGVEALAIATFCSTLAQAEAAREQAAQLTRIADALYSGEGSPLSIALADLINLIHNRLEQTP